MSAGRAPRGGFTLLEAMVAVAVLGISVLVAGVSIGSALGRDRVPDSWVAQLEAGRQRAVLSGQPSVVLPDSAHRVSPVLFLPDGRAVGEGVDPLTGRAEVAP